MSTWRRWLVAAALALAACSSSNEGGGPDARPPMVDAGGGGNPDAPAAATFAGFLIDLIQNQTSDTTDPVAVDFGTPDSEDPGTFDTLF